MRYNSAGGATRNGRDMINECRETRTRPMGQMQRLSAHSVSVTIYRHHVTNVRGQREWHTSLHKGELSSQTASWLQHYDHCFAVKGRFSTTKDSASYSGAKSSAKYQCNTLSTTKFTPICHAGCVQVARGHLPAGAVAPASGPERPAFSGRRAQSSSSAQVAAHNHPHPTRPPWTNIPPCFVSNVAYLYCVMY